MQFHPGRPADDEPVRESKLLDQSIFDVDPHDPSSPYSDLEVALNLDQDLAEGSSVALLEADPLGET